MSNEEKRDDGLPEWLLQIIAFILTGALFYLDKFIHKFDEEISSYVYGGLLAIGFLGKRGFLVILGKLGITIQDISADISKDNNKNKTTKK